MSRPVSLDFEFCPHEFAELLKKAKGKRKQYQFAADIGMSKTYLNKYLVEKADKPLTPSTIRKIAAASTESVSFKELLRSSGYDPSKYIFQNPGAVFERIGIAIVTSCLANSNFRWKSMAPVVPMAHKFYYDYAIEIYDEPLFSRWFFNFKRMSSSIQRVYNIIGGIFTEIFTHPLNISDKYSIVTDSEEFYDRLVDMKIYNTPINISAILIDTVGIRVLKEEYMNADERKIDDKFLLTKFF